MVTNIIYYYVVGCNTLPSVCSVNNHVITQCADIFDQRLLHMKQCSKIVLAGQMMLEISGLLNIRVEHGIELFLLKYSITDTTLCLESQTLQVRYLQERLLASQCVPYVRPKDFSITSFFIEIFAFRKFCYLKCINESINIYFFNYAFIEFSFFKKF